MLFHVEARAAQREAALGVANPPHSNAAAGAAKQVQPSPGTEIEVSDAQNLAESDGRIGESESDSDDPDL